MRATRLAGALALALGAAACGDDSGDGDGATDGRVDGQPDADTDAPPPATFTSFVIDLVTNQTAGNTDPRPFADFSSLDDPDTNNADAYDSLFP